MSIEVALIFLGVWQLLNSVALVLLAVRSAGSPTHADMSQLSQRLARIEGQSQEALNRINVIHDYLLNQRQP